MKNCENCGATLPLIQAVIAYQAGDNQAFQIIYDETEKSIYASLLKIVGGCVNAQAMIEDIMKATYMEIGRTLGELDRPENFVAWLSKVATRNCFVFLNANQPNPYWYDIPYGMAEQQVGEYILPNTVEHDVAVQNSVRMIMEQQFTSMEKFCIVSHYYNGIAIEELSQSIGVPSQSIVRNLNSAKTKLCKALLATEKEKSTGMSELSPWLVTLFKQDVEKIMVPRRIHDLIKNAIAGVILGMPGVLTSGVVLTGATKATGSITVNSAISGTGLNSIAGTTIGGTAMGGAAGTIGQSVMGAVPGVQTGVQTGAQTGVQASAVTNAVGTGAKVVPIGADAGAAVTTGTITNGAAAGAVTGAATGGGVTTGILSTVGAKVALAIAGVAVLTSGGLVIRHNLMKDKKEPKVTEETIAENPFDDNWPDDNTVAEETEQSQLYRVKYDYYENITPYDAGDCFAELTIESERYKLLANTLESEMKRYKSEVEAKRDEKNELAQSMFGEDAKYCVQFKVSRADDAIFSCIVDERWNTYTDATYWDPFATIDAKTGEILTLEDLCDVTELQSCIKNGLDEAYIEIDELYGEYPHESPEEMMTSLNEDWKEWGQKWFLTAEGIAIYIPRGLPIHAGCWTLMIPYQDIPSFEEKYLPKGAMASDITAEIGIQIFPSAYKIDWNNDGKYEILGEDGSYRNLYPVNSNFCVKNANGQTFFVHGNPVNEEWDGTKVFLVTDEGEVEVTNQKANELVVCSMSGDIAYCYDYNSGEYAYYQVTDEGLIPFSGET